ncbi:MAG: DNA-3-methyladenine glycosylase I [Chloroflexi bacterium]|jgi:DNA-3-methyladenine glycosylase I|nr:DNA-3-methyladenine glycosylase I [Chloroflexota bacterium]MBT4073615.1 DNA-3-methyladenine glycosylase I [Chloroflexota bacterium]MBT4515364.1 DNA-3-methyladenine glycosylase I [Chloroflexota bacterium]MBT5318501.1 DNA-3-methyladenine glycosylase I [Chloroflexota bacterium]MBT6682649.1 DNA-3-methyladenine glycosylase I [Chloroflexota bacterium]
MTSRCEWAEGNDLMEQYHDTEWGVPSHDDSHLFEMLVLEGSQAGLSWQTILNKREGYRRAFANFDLATISAYGESDVERLVQDPGIVRHRGKIEATIGNANTALEVQAEFGSLDSYLWGLAGGKPVKNAPATMANIEATTYASESMSKALRKRGFRFVGPTTVYAFMQSAGMVNDHVVTCFRYNEV